MAGEWETGSALLRVVGSAAAWLRDCVEGLEVDAPRLRANLELTGGLVMAESVATALTPALGRPEAHAAVERASRRAVEEQRSLGDVLVAEGLLDPSEVADALGPERYLGAAGAFVERALAAHRGMSRP